MPEVLRAADAWFDRIERATEWCAGPPERRWSWFQIAWSGLHLTAVVMHVLSVVYHARRVRQEAGQDQAGPSGGPWQARTASGDTAVMAERLLRSA